MAAAQLRQLGILGSELVTDVIEQLDVGLLRVLFHGVYKGPRHGTRSLGSDRSIGPEISSSAQVPAKT